ncbi:Fanconi anemia core complex-associated protein 100 [Huso huso]|uniref:Fanconi anemia core complex-associated protein 100 n=1 Tax=Huso huso TaxID=61971 RepID=A0ABR0Z0S2_HUSHU
MAGRRCVVDCLAAFQSPALVAEQAGSSQVICRESDIYLCNGSEFVSVYSKLEKCVKVIYSFPGNVCHLAEDTEKDNLYVLCAKDGVYCIPLQNRMSTGSQSHGDLVGSCSVSPDSCVLRDPTVLSFIFLESILVTVGQAGKTWTLSLFETVDKGQSPYRKLEELQVPILATRGTSSAGTDWRPPALCCIYPHGAKGKARSGTGHFSLEPGLFSLLFGVDASMVASPVVLCGLPDGRLCCLPLRLPVSLAPADKGEESKVRVLHHLGQPVCFIGASLAGEKGNGCLLALGRGGKVLVVTPRLGSEGRVAGFTEQHLSSPVASACCSGTHLYYSTGSQLLALQLSPGTPEAGDSKDSWERAVPDQTLPVPPHSLSPVSLNVCSLAALALPADSPTGAVELVAMTQKGTLLQITLPERSDGGQRARLTSSLAGQRIRDLLAGIGNVSDRVSSLKSCIQQKNDALKHLNQVFNVCCMLLSNQEGGEKGASQCKQPISCHVSARWSRLLLQDTLILTCCLENSSDYVLEQGWTLCIQVTPQSCPLTPETAGSARTYAFPFDKLLPSKSMEVTLPLAPGSDLVLPVSVHCSLAYSLKSILGVEAIGHLPSHNPLLSSQANDGHCISLALSTQTVDWLDCLRICEPVAMGNRACSWSNPLADPVQVLLSSRKAMGQNRDPKNKGAGLGLDGGPFVASVKVSSEVLTTALKLRGSGPSLASSTLHWLLSSNPEADSLRSQALPVLTAAAPGGSKVRLLAKEICLRDLSADRPITAVEIQIESSSLAELCGLHHSILCRIQPLLKEGVSGDGALPGLRTQRLRELLHHAEVLSKEVQGVRDRMSLGLEASSSTAEKLLHTYQQLRNTDLLLL